MHILKVERDVLETLIIIDNVDEAIKIDVGARQRAQCKGAEATRQHGGGPSEGYALKSDIAETWVARSGVLGL